MPNPVEMRRSSESSESSANENFPMIPASKSHTNEGVTDAMQGKIKKPKTTSKDKKSKNNF
jgi:hypothetical protein